MSIVNPDILDQPDLKSQLLEVAWELLVEFQENLDQTSLESCITNFSKKIESNFPVIENFKEFEQLFKIKQGSTQMERRRVFDGINFYRDQSKNEFVRFTAYDYRGMRIALITKIHKNIDSLIENLSWITDGIKSDFKEIKIIPRRLGLRYINLCKLADNDLSRYPEFFNFPFNGIGKFKLGELKNLSAQLLEEVGNFALRTVYRTVFDEKTIENNLIIDMDCFTSKDLSISELEKITSELGNLIKERFVNSITEEYFHKYMENEEL